MSSDLERLEEIEQGLVEQGLEGKYRKPGIYSISLNGQIVYIGKSKDMLHRLASHIQHIESASPQGNKYRVLHKAIEEGYRVKFDVMYYSPCLLDEEIDQDIGEEEGKLIRFYLPVLNYQIPKEGNYKSFSINKLAKVIRLEDIVTKAS